MFNPLKERGLERFTDPQNPIEMATRKSTPIATQYHQVKAGGDIAALVGICKYVIEADDQCQRINAPAILDHAFIAEHTTGFRGVRRHGPRDRLATLEHESGITRQDMEAAGQSTPSRSGSSASTAWA